MMGEEAFQLHVAIPAYDTSHMSLYKAIQETTQQSSFSVCAKQGILSLLRLNRVFFPCVLYKFPNLLFCHGNRTKWSLVITG